MNCIDSITKEYRTIRIARETKFWINELIIYKENELKSKKK